MVTGRRQGSWLYLVYVRYVGNVHDLFTVKVAKNCWAFAKEDKLYVLIIFETRRNIRMQQGYGCK